MTEQQKIWRPPKVWPRSLVIGLILVVLSFLPIDNTFARVEPVPLHQENPPTVAELIQAVNNLRLANDLEPLTQHPILMQTAQAQADALLYTGGAVGHTRPDGLSYTDQLLLLGYPLAGDLSLGGYRAENFIVVRPGTTVEEVIQMWLGDGPHTNTMLSPFYKDIGAGIAFDGDEAIYLVIDCARPTASGKPQAYTPEAGFPAQADAQGVSPWIQPVVRATARPDGDVIHHVKNGQSLWSIAIAYETKIEQIRRYNNLGDTTIYTGQILLVQKGATQPPPPPSGTPTPTPTPQLSPTPSPLVNSLTPALGTAIAQKSPQKTPEPASRPSYMLLIGGIFILSMLLGWLITWVTGSKREG